MEFIHNQGKLYIFGGRGTRHYYNDMWSTEDLGLTWKDEGKAPWRPCFNFATSGNALTNDTFYMLEDSSVHLTYQIFGSIVQKRRERLEASAVWGSRNAFRSNSRWQE